MQVARAWLCATIVVVTLGGAGMLIPTAPSAGAAQGKVLQEHWRYHDGHWGYYYPADKRWYYTNGQHWFFEEKGAWKLYNFDKEFGRGEHFEKAEYKAPGINIKIQLPNHAVFRL